MPHSKAVRLELSEIERSELERLVRRHKTAQALALRARIILLAANGLTNTTIAARLGVDLHRVGRWRQRFAGLRLDGLFDEPRPGASRTIGDEAIAETIRRTLETRPAGVTHWSLRSRSPVSDYAPSTVHRIWRLIGLQPRCTEIFKLSTDPRFVEKYAISPAGILCRRIVPSSCAWMRRPKCKRPAALSRCCRCTPDKPRWTSSSAPSTALLRAPPPNWKRPSMTTSP
jgi:transposase